MKTAFRPGYALAFAILLAVEMAIALFVRDAFVRPLVGDALVVVLLYCAVRAFAAVEYRRAALGVFLFACLIETLQYFEYVRRLGLENNRVLATALGRTFAWVDFAAYAAGFAAILIFEKMRQNKA